MRITRIYMILTVIGLVLTTQCKQPDEVEPIKHNKIREITTAFKDSGLVIFRNSLKTISTDKDASSSVFDRVNWNTVYKVFNSETKLTT